MDKAPVSVEASDVKKKKPGPAKKKVESVRCVCSSTVDSGHMVECERCKMWCHSKCVGVAQSIASTFPFICPFCVKTVFSVLDSLNNTILNQTKEILALREEVDVLKNSLSDKLTSITSSLVAVTDNDTTLTPSYASVAQAKRSSRDIASSAAVFHNQSDRKFNVVLYGISENPKGTKKSLRQIRHFESVSSIVNAVDSGISGHSIRDCTRLGKFSESHTRPRPILVKLNCKRDVISILTNRTKLATGIFVKPDMSLQERKVEALILKERRSLINSGTDSKHIKIRGNSLFVRNNVFGSVDVTGSELKFIFSSNTPNSSLVLNNGSTTTVSSNTTTIATASSVATVACDDPQSSPATASVFVPAANSNE